MVEASPINYREANRRYRRLYWPVIAAYVVICISGPVLFKLMGDPPKWFVAIVAVLTSAPIAGVFWLMGRWVRETDEYTRTIQTQALLGGGAITLTIAVIWGFLELYRVIPRFEHFPAMIMVGPAFFLFYGATFIAQQLRRGERISDPLMCIGEDKR